MSDKDSTPPARTNLVPAWRFPESMRPGLPCFVFYVSEEVPPSDPADADNPDAPDQSDETASRVQYAAAYRAGEKAKAGEDEG